MTAISL